MVLSLLPAPPEPRPPELRPAEFAAALTRAAGAATLDGPASHRPITRATRACDGLAELERISHLWQDLPDMKRRAWLRSREIVLPPGVLLEDDIALLPGGAVTLRGPDAILVCDPAEATTFNELETKRLRRVLHGRAEVSTLFHTEDGVLLRSRIPKSLPPQAVTIVPDAARLPVRVCFTGAFLIQWGVRGAVGWPLVEAPACFALAASLAASPAVKGGHGAIHRGGAIASETWQATDADSRYELIAPALSDHISNVLADTVHDELRLAILETCVEDDDSLARRIAEDLAMLPVCFQADPDALPGAPPAAWQHGIAHIRDADRPLALLGLDNLLAPVAAMRALRDSLEDAEVVAFDEDGDVLPGGPVALHSDAALFQARKAGPRGRLGIVVPAPALPVDLYVLAHDVAGRTGQRVIAIAPCWGFCHRVGPDGEEAGNAAWFGMGAGLDEMDVPPAGFWHGA